MSTPTRTQFFNKMQRYVQLMDALLYASKRPGLLPGRGLSASALEDDDAEEREPTAAEVDELRKLAKVKDPWASMPRFLRDPTVTRDGALRGRGYGDIYAPEDTEHFLDGLIHPWDA